MTDDGHQPYLERAKTKSKIFAPGTLISGLSQSFSKRAAAPVPERNLEERKHLFEVAMNRTKSFYVKNDLSDTVSELGTDIVHGLTTNEAQRRLVAHGRNEMAKDPPTPMWRVFLAQFEDLLVIMLVVACIVSFALGQFAAATTIVVIVVLNAILGVTMEVGAGAALETLESSFAQQCTVLRDGKLMADFDSAELVPGDIVILNTGDKAPADARLIQSQDMCCNEMGLTGESEPVKKQPDQIERAPGKEAALTENHMVYMGCEICQGTGRAVVVSTGMGTKMGEIGAMMQSVTEQESPLQVKLHKLGVKLGLASLGISIVVFIVGVATGRGGDPASDESMWLQMLLVAVSLTVAAVPEGLPACVTITLAMGMKNMAKNQAQIKKLHSVETLGSASVICSDKTGTLTAGVMTTVRLWFGGDIFRITSEGNGGFNPVGALVPEATDVTNPALVAKQAITHGPVTVPLLVALLGCDQNTELQLDEETKEWTCIGNNSEKPLVVAAAKVGIKRAEVSKLFKIITTNPFTSERKMMSTLVHMDKPGEESPFGSSPFVACVKGAPNIVLEKCNSFCVNYGGNVKVQKMRDEQRDAIMQVVDDFSEKAFRVLAIAYRPMDDHPGEDGPKELEDGLVLAGLMASIDPDRQGVTPSIKKAVDAGVRVCMITGDYIKTAKAIAKNISLLSANAPEHKAIDCETIRTMGIQERELMEACGKKPSQELVALRKDIDFITNRTDVYARAKPADKMTIVRSLQRQGHVVAMTGDGVNDAPALSQADIGVAMGKAGTDVARAAADMVLLDDNFVSIVDAIEQGRTIYANIGKFCFYLLSTNVAEVFVILIAILMGFSAPLLPVQILWLNLVTDGAPAIALAVELAEPGIMEEGPRDKLEPLLEKVMITGICIQTVLLTGVVLFTYVFMYRWNLGTWDGQPGADMDLFQLTVKKARSATIFVIVFAELMRAYTSRSLRQSVFTVGLCTNKWMQYSVGIAVALTLLLFNLPVVQDVFGVVRLTGEEWAFVAGMSFVCVICDEITKAIYRCTGFGKRVKRTHVQGQESGDPEQVRLHISE